MTRIKMASLAEQISKLSNPNPVFHDPEDVDDGNDENYSFYSYKSMYFMYGYTFCSKSIVSI